MKNEVQFVGKTTDLPSNKISVVAIKKTKKGMYKTCTPAVGKKYVSIFIRYDGVERTDFYGEEAFLQLLKTLTEFELSGHMLVYGKYTGDEIMCLNHHIVTTNNVKYVYSATDVVTVTFNGVRKVRRMMQVVDLVNLAKFSLRYDIEYLGKDNAVTSCDQIGIAIDKKPFL